MRRSSALLLLTASVAAACLSDYKSVFDVCVHVNWTRRKYCNSQRYCHFHGGEILKGANYMKFKGKTFSGQPKRYWIGLTDLLDERKTSKQKWRWTDGSLFPPSKNVRWFWDEPEKSANDLTYVLRPVQYVYDTINSAKLSVVCQQKAPTKHSRFFRTTPISKSLAGNDFASIECVKRVKNSPSMVDCSSQCLSVEDGWCVSVYFHQQRQECVLVLYTDATIDVQPQDGQWKKLVIAH